ncbi:sialidase family protein [Imhoffiella purpurea]|uniref:Sialidase domain-containing protein n=1 Tax=Imhoffiella purpurea TaxID=1249627 RepID=W9VC70_9GAMM|nr:sialidase family protein [Imhoffiella purpurea]EXJ17188.1 hypothetical protein D779_0015 [Imhoffiella purpurea]
MNYSWLDSLRSVRLAGVISVFIAALGSGGAIAADAAPGLSTSSVLLSSHPMDVNGAWSYAVDRSGQRWVAYYDQERLLRLIEPTGKERLLVPEGRGQAPSGLAMAPASQGAELLWRDKFPSKGLYLLDSAREDMKPLEVAGDTEPLARFVATERDGLLHLLWYGEKTLEETSEKHNLFYRQLNPETQNLSPIEWVSPGIYPLMSVGDSGVMVYTWMETELGNQIVSRFRPLDEAFADAVPVAVVSEISPVFEAFRSGSRWFTVWLGLYGSDKRDFRLEGAWSDDNGKTWDRFEIQALRGLDIASLQIVSDDDGHISMAATGRKRIPGVKTKQNVYLVNSSDRGDTWEAVSDIRGGTALGQPAEAKTDLSQFQARNPVISFGSKPGELLIVWEDWRDIRGNLYASLSNDYGKTWSLSNVLLPTDPGKSVALRYEPNSLFYSDGKFNLIAERFLDDTFLQKELIELSFTKEDLERFAETAKSQPALDNEENRKRLREREADFWKAMIDKDYEKTYSYLDPFFKARVPYETYVSLMGKIKYESAEVESVTIDGPRALVVTDIKASIPEFKAPNTGEVLSQPQREAAVKNYWLWLDGNWFREFFVESRDIVFSRY